MQKLIKILAIDGPSGSGKGTVSKMLAKHLGWHMLDSGALYRALALYVLQDCCALNDIGRIAHLASVLPVRFSDAKVYLAEVDVSHDIRSESCSDVTSKIASIPAVRDALLDLQRTFAQPPGLVADGRDMGTVIFPEAFVKIYLDASVEERAKRRFMQLKDGGYNVNLQDLVADIIQRDVRDRTRAVAPLKPAPDAIILETTSMSVELVFQAINDLVQQRLSNF